MLRSTLNDNGALMFSRIVCAQYCLIRLDSFNLDILASVVGKASSLAPYMHALCRDLESSHAPVVSGGHDSLHGDGRCVRRAVILSDSAVL